MDKNLIDFQASPTSGASPGSSPYYNRTFWAAYKGMARGQLGGIVLGGLMGLGIGMVLCAGAAVLMPAFGLAAAGIVTAATTAVGMKYYYDVMRDVGNVSGAMSAAMEVNEERSTVLNIKLDTIVNALARQGHLSKQEIGNIQDQIEKVYQQGEASFEKKFFKKPAVVWQVAAIGAAAGLALVGAIIAGGHFAFGDALMEGGLFGEAGLTTSSLMGLGLAGGALAGASYGINRDYLRPVVNLTNALFEGDVKEFKRQQGLQKTIPMETSLTTNVVATNGSPPLRAGQQVPTPIISGGMTVLLGKEDKTTMRYPTNADAADKFQARLDAERAEAQLQPHQIH